MPHAVMGMLVMLTSVACSCPPLFSRFFSFQAKGSADVRIYDWLFRFTVLMLIALFRI